MDGASHHTTEESLDYFVSEGLRVLISSPLSPQVAPVELVHGYMKAVDLRQGLP